jgi:universal stress protein A
MSLFKHIICPYDNSEFAKKALMYGGRLAKCDGAELSVLFVMVNPFVFEGGNPILGNNVLAADLLGKMRKEETEELEKTHALLKEKFPDVKINEVLLENNDVADAIKNYQEKLNADLVVMGSHGRKGIKRFLLGSVAEAVLRNINCPVLIVK